MTLPNENPTGEWWAIIREADGWCITVARSAEAAERVAATRPGLQVVRLSPEAAESWGWTTYYDAMIDRFLPGWAVDKPDYDAPIDDGAQC